MTVWLIEFSGVDRLLLHYLSWIENTHISMTFDKGIALLGHSNLEPHLSENGR